MRDERVFKILTENEWDKFQKEKESAGTELDIKDGFIHLCSREQAIGVIDRYFKDMNVITLELTNQDLLDAIRWESSTNNEYFPHLYVERIYLHDFQICHIHS
ncbi:DUF952 domain-containing protein [Halobacteriovorax sp. GB3]|uniref:DUF952 domain-containing protein n=1 Tax=Halobacteriovorax sp. GB3 TaxID=2719615 RepID=UPI003FCE4F77